VTGLVVLSDCWLCRPLFIPGSCVCGTKKGATGHLRIELVFNHGPTIKIDMILKENDSSARFRIKRQVGCFGLPYRWTRNDPQRPN
jgi:hypothetical protein